MSTHVRLYLCNFFICLRFSSILSLVEFNHKFFLEAYNYTCITKMAVQTILAYDMITLCNYFTTIVLIYWLGFITVFS